MNNTIVQKSEKIHYFERKLNKWVKNFEQSETDNANRHNDLISKINEVDDVYEKECKVLHAADSRLNKRISAFGDGSGLLVPKDRHEEVDSDNVSTISR